MARILFVTAEAIDTAVLVVGAELRRRGHDVRVLGHVDEYPRVAAARLGFAALALTPAGLSREIRALDPRPGVEVQLELARRPPDLAVVDATLLTALKALTGLPCAVLVPGFLSDVEDWARGPVRLAARLRRLRPATLWAGVDRVLVLSDAELDPATELADNARRTGPALGPLRERVREFEPLVVVDLADSTVVRSVLDGLDDGVSALVAGEDLDAAALPLPAGAELRSPLDRAESLSRAWLYVGDGGHATTMRALANDVPVLAPSTSVTEAVAAAGAGRALSADPAADVRALLADGPHHDAAATIGARLRSSDGTAAAADELEALAARRSPTP